LNDTAVTPWYKQFWPWFILSPLIMVICASFWMLYIATVTHDGAIVDNYYKDGLSIIERTEQDQWAADMNLGAQLQTIGERVQLRVSGDLKEWPNALTLLYVFKTKASEDVEVRLERTPDGRYIGQLPQTIQGERDLLLEPADTPSSGNHWRLHGHATLPSSSILTLQPRVE